MLSARTWDAGNSSASDQANAMYLKSDLTRLCILILLLLARNPTRFPGREAPETQEPIRSRLASVISGGARDLARSGTGPSVVDRRRHAMAATCKVHVLEKAAS